MTKWLAILAAVLPTLVLLGAVLLHNRRRRKSGARPPISEKLLRPPGYSTSREIEKRLEQVQSSLFGVGVCSVGLGLVILLTAESEKASQYVPALALLALAVVVFCWLAWRKAVSIRPLRLGLLGEQAVAEQLHKLTRKGYEVFHDVPGSGRWNIDHVIVGPGGVFAIETKCRVKKTSANDLPEHEAVFDGKTIHFPWCADDKSAAQAERNAKWLAKWLSKAVGEPVKAHPIVALPGWYVKLKTDSEIKVLSGKQLPGHIGGEPPRLSDKLIQQIAHRLDERCRDVEF